MKNPVFIGSGVALATPFTDNGVNLPVYRKLIDFVINGHTDALITCGTTGEPSTMTDEERASVIACAVEQSDGRVPVIVGVGTNDTKKVLANAKQAAALGADALLIVTPYYNKATQKGLLMHYNLIADSTDLPVIIYNVPSRTGLSISPETIERLSHHPNIVGLKESSHDIERMTRLAMIPNLDLYSGDDDVVVPFLALGAKGVISVVANIYPAIMHEIVADWMSSNIEQSREKQLRIYPLVKALFSEVNPIPIKTALRELGFDMGPLRLPLCEMEDQNAAQLRAVMKDLALL